MPRLDVELAEIKTQIHKEEVDRDESLAQARTSQKAALEKSLRLALDSLKQAKQDKELELSNANRQADHAQEELEQAQQALSLTRVDIRKHENLGMKRSIEHTHTLITQVSALSQRLAETAIENIDPTMHGSLSSSAGLKDLLEISNRDIDRICTQASEFASDDHVDVSVRQQLTTLLFDNAAMRKQLNAYTEGILTQTMERLDTRDKIKESNGDGGGALAFGWGEKKGEKKEEKKSSWDPRRLVGGAESRV